MADIPTAAQARQALDCLENQRGIEVEERSIATLAAYIDSAEKAQADARRYRWLREEPVYDGQVDIDGNMVWCLFGRQAGECRPIETQELDAAIDASIAARTQQAHKET